jgi:hypothetical protein
LEEVNWANLKVSAVHQLRQLVKKELFKFQAGFLFHTNLIFLRVYVERNLIKNSSEQTRLSSLFLSANNVLQVGSATDKDVISHPKRAAST